ncbi:MAG: FHA domain-containing protein [Deltaproteobacteria bacterium]|nr:FHA domain-containing protein [Deltaproteobacteria bacterium]
MAKYGILVVEPPDGAPTRYALDAAAIAVGRGPENDIVVLDLKVSRRHAALRCSETGVVVDDLGSANGFKHNRRRVRHAALAHGDLLVIGDTRLRYLGAATDLQQEETAVTGFEDDGLDCTVADHSQPRLLLTTSEGTRAFPIASAVVTIGRSPQADLVIDDSNVSRLHARIERAGDCYTLIDNGSRNGTLVGGAPVQRAELRSGMTFVVGPAQITFQAPYGEGDLSVATTASPLEARPGLGRPSIERLVERGGAAPQAVPRRAPTRAVAVGRQPVVVVPGFMGSTLLDGDRQLWPDVKRFMKRPEFLQLPETLDLKSGDLVSEVVVVPGLIKLDAYNRLSEYLETGLLYTPGENLFGFAYDWRRDLRHAARQLGEQIAIWEERVDLSRGRFVIVAHSAGGLVARYYVERMGGRHHVDRLILMGCPNRGTLKTLAVMLGGVSLLPFGARKERVREVMATFPAAYQLLPTEPQVYDVDGRAIDLFGDRDWVPEKVLPLIDDARAFLSELGTRSRVPVVSIFGYGQKTIVRINVRRDRDGRFGSATLVEDERGDGTVSQISAVLEGSEIHPVQQHHGALYTDNDVKMRLRLELLGQP